MHIPSNLFKSTLLAFVVFWSIMGSDNMPWDMSPFIILSFAPIFFCVTIVIIITICTVLWCFVKEDFGPQTVFKTFFPYYSIITFIICALAIISSGFDLYIIAFFTSVFITTCQSWAWFARGNPNRNSTNKIVPKPHNNIDL